jgi:RNA polymerase sigma-70 factor (ECF subfamily)
MRVKKGNDLRVESFGWLHLHAAHSMNVDTVSLDPQRVRAGGSEFVTAPGRRSWLGARARAPAVDRSLELIEELYREEAPRFRRVAFAIVHDLETAEDVVQEAFANAVLRRRSFRGSGEVSGWIWRIVVNTALSRRRRGRLEARVCEWPELRASEGPDVEFRDRRLREHVSKLPERQKLALFLRYYADLDYDAIADVLSIAPGTVGKLLHDARTTIGRAVEREADG